LAGKVTEHDYRAQALAWWDDLGSPGAIRDFRGRAALTARLALCILSATPNEAPRLGDHLSWFLEALSFMGINTQGPIDAMTKFFAWR